MTNLVCLMDKSEKFESGWRIYLIVPEDDPVIARMTNDGTNKYWRTRPYEEGDVPMQTGNQVMLALQVLSKYSLNLNLCAEHDQIWIGVRELDHEDLLKKMSEEDIKRMDQLDFFESEDSWSTFT